MLSAKKSERSIKSQLSSVASFTHGCEDERLMFEKYLPYICSQFCCPKNVVVNRKEMIDFSKELKMTRSLKKVHERCPSPMKTPETTKSGDTNRNFGQINPDKIYVDAFYDNNNRLVEISVNKTILPRVFIKILIFIIPIYKNLTKLTLQRCRIDFYTIYDINERFTLTSLTDLCFDDSPVLSGNYALLLTSINNLKCLSLQRCQITDKACQEIAEKLHFPNPAENTLLVLNLASNEITNAGAKSLGDALRSNRHLVYLNLADNIIDDDGVGYILDSLMEFLLTVDEIAEQRSHFVQYLNVRQALYNQYSHHNGVQSSVAASDNVKIKKPKSLKERFRSGIPSSKSSNVDNQLHAKVDMMVDRTIGPYVDPFSKRFVTKRGDYYYYSGNRVLCYLNLSYNRLSYLSLKKLLNVMRQQNEANDLTGLLNVILEGNQFPENCMDLVELRSLLLKKLSRLSAETTPNSSKSKKNR